MYKAIIVEDEFLLAKVIENYLLNFESISLVHKYESAIEALNFLEKEKVDLIFLDIE
ncbi:MAG TPA: response regulator, partial [Flavobacteriaceae bacterium]|nr:response regulator [Flavobacteriaceae bacterium]